MICFSGEAKKVCETKLRPETCVCRFIQTEHLGVTEKQLTLYDTRIKNAHTTSNNLSPSLLAPFNW